MMIENSSKVNYQAKQEDNDGGMKIEKFSKAAASTSSRQWTAMRNPRIVRVSRSLGGKDRHSKVCTIRGLRDRRIRLSVPTAIQLYDLQDRLGLSQPSKVVDWLLEVTKSDIDKLPPLDFPQFFQQALLPPHHHHHHHHHHEPAAGTSFSLGGFYHDTNLIKDMDYSVARLKGKEAESVFSKWWMKTNEQDQNQGSGGASNSHKHFQIGTNPSNANAMTYNSSSYYHMDVPSNLSLSQFGSHGNNLFPTSSGSAMQFPSSNLSVVPSCSQLLFCPSSATPTPPSLSSLFTPHAPPFMSNNSMESTDIPRQSNHFQFLSSSSSQLNMPHVFNSPLGQRHSIITPFSSKLLDSDNHNNRSQPEDMDSARS